MIALRRLVRGYGGLVAQGAKMFLAHRGYVYAEVVAQLVGMAAAVCFWRSLFATRSQLGGLERAATLDYVVLAQVLAPLVYTPLIPQIGRAIHEGRMAIELVRPIDFQLRWHAELLGFTLMRIAFKLPVLLVAVWLFGLSLTADPVRWAGFAVSLLLGQVVLFAYEWLFAALAFYTTQVWGLYVVHQAVMTFASGALLPPAMMPAAAARVFSGLPFAQVLSVPVGLLAGIQPTGDLLAVWCGQLAWIAALLICSRAAFRVASRRLVIHGG